jgi:phage gp36-like protein
MAYIVIADLNALLPEAYQIKATDDNRTGEADAAIWNAIADTASNEVDALLSPSFDVPISPVPVVCKQAALWIALEMAYTRRAVSNEAVTKRAEAWREQIKDIGDGKRPLSADSYAAQGFDDFDPTYGTNPEDPDA